MAARAGLVLGAGTGVLAGYALPVPVVLALAALAGLVVAGIHLLDRGLAQNRF